MALRHFGGYTLLLKGTAFKDGVAAPDNASQRQMVA